MLSLLALLAVITVIQRFVVVHRQLVSRPPAQGGPAAGPS
jgi:hypothetical protein